MIRLWLLRLHCRCLQREAERLRAELAGLEWALARNARESMRVAAAGAEAERQQKAAVFSRQYRVLP